jgi:hypothetical protein
MRFLLLITSFFFAPLLLAGSKDKNQALPPEQPLIIHYECFVSDITSEPKANPNLVVKNVRLDKAGKIYELFKGDKWVFTLQVPLGTTYDDAGKKLEDVANTLNLCLSSTKADQSVCTHTNIGNRVNLADTVSRKIVSCYQQ